MGGNSYSNDTVTTTTRTLIETAPTAEKTFKVEYEILVRGTIEVSAKNTTEAGEKYDRLTDKELIEHINNTANTSIEALDVETACTYINEPDDLPEVDENSTKEQVHEALERAKEIAKKHDIAF